MRRECHYTDNYNCFAVTCEAGPSLRRKRGNEEGHFEVHLNALSCTSKETNTLEEVGYSLVLAATLSLLLNLLIVAD